MRSTKALLATIAALMMGLAACALLGFDYAGLPSWSAAKVANYRVEIGGETVGFFRNVAGLVPCKGPVGMSLTLGSATSDHLWRWRREALAGFVNRRTGRVVVMDELGNELKTYQFTGAWLSRWDGDPRRVKRLDLTVEEIERL